VESNRGAPETVASIRRRWGKLYTVTTSEERRFLVLRDGSTERFLEEGAALSHEDLDALAGPAARAAGLALAYRLLAGRDRTERAICAALAKEAVTAPEVVGYIVVTLRRQGYLDDRRLASHYVRYAAAHRPSGPHLMRRRLRVAGVDDDIIDEELRAAMPPEREREMALALARGKLRGAKDRARAARRIHGFLARRGFSERVVSSICAAILGGALPGEDE
jgi:regulatory protein